MRERIELNPYVAELMIIRSRLLADLKEINARIRVETAPRPSVPPKSSFKEFDASVVK